MRQTYYDQHACSRRSDKTRQRRIHIWGTVAAYIDNVFNNPNAFFHPILTGIIKAAGQHRHARHHSWRVRYNRQRKSTLGFLLCQMKAIPAF